jgi:hypothetical protein
VSDAQQTPAPAPAAPATIIDFANLDEAGFRKFYAEKLEPCFSDNENDRIAAVAAFRRRGAIAVLVTAAIAVALWLFTKRIEAPLFGGFIVGAIGYAFAMQKLVQVGRRVKEGYCTAIGQAMGASYTMGGFDPPALDRFQQWRMIPGFDRSHTRTSSAVFIWAAPSTFMRRGLSSNIPTPKAAPIIHKYSWVN